ncbi:hypothetical protein chiPu_0032628, partial [Chiloscyllium punctatum]|nr:hypothetical protein [Chiloscyllium punctatum]
MGDGRDRDGVRDRCRAAGRQGADRRVDVAAEPRRRPRRGRLGRRHLCGARAGRQRAGRRRDRSGRRAPGDAVRPRRHHARCGLRRARAVT